MRVLFHLFLTIGSIRRVGPTRHSPEQTKPKFLGTHLPWHLVVPPSRALSKSLGLAESSPALTIELLAARVA